jgi:hypothetical protein
MPVKNGYEVTTIISAMRLSDVLCTFVEGGGNFWGRIQGWRKPKDFLCTDNQSDKWNYPLNERGALFIYDAEEYEEEGKNAKRYTLTAAKIQRALTVMSKEEPDIISRIIEEQDDAYDASALVQYAIFGRIKIG